MLCGPCAQGFSLLHAFLARLQQAPRRKQPAVLLRDRHLLESFPSQERPHSAPAGPVSPAAAGDGGKRAASPPRSPPSAPRDADEVVLRCSTAADGSADAGAPPLPAPAPHPDELTHFQVDGLFDVHGVGTVASGTVVRGCVRLGDTLLWGPSGEDDTFSEATVAGIHRSQVPVTNVAAGQYATIALGAGGLPRADVAAPLLNETYREIGVRFGVATPRVAGSEGAATLPAERDAFGARDSLLSSGGLGASPACSGDSPILQRAGATLLLQPRQRGSQSRASVIVSGAESPMAWSELPLCSPDAPVTAGHAVHAAERRLCRAVALMAELSASRRPVRRVRRKLSWRLCSKVGQGRPGRERRW